MCKADLCAKQGSPCWTGFCKRAYVAHPSFIAPSDAVWFKATLQPFSPTLTNIPITNEVALQKQMLHPAGGGGGGGGAFVPLLGNKLS